MNTPFKNTKVTLGLALGAVISTSVLAQSGSLRSEYSDLADLYNALDVTQAGIYGDGNAYGWSLRRVRN